MYWDANSSSRNEYLLVRMWKIGLLYIATVNIK